MAEEEWEADKVRGVLCDVVAVEGAVAEGLRDDGWGGGVDEVGDVEGGVGDCVDDVDLPAQGGVAAVPVEDVAEEVWGESGDSGFPKGEYGFRIGVWKVWGGECWG